jgi:hypothetical protein
MLTALIVFLRTMGLICRGHRAVALENLALLEWSPLSFVRVRSHSRSRDGRTRNDRRPVVIERDRTNQTTSAT